MPEVWTWWGHSVCWVISLAAKKYWASNEPWKFTIISVFISLGFILSNNTGLNLLCNACFIWLIIVYLATEFSNLSPIRPRVCRSLTITISWLWEEMPCRSPLLAAWASDAVVRSLTWAGGSFVCSSMNLTLQNKCITSGFPKEATCKIWSKGGLWGLSRCMKHKAKVLNQCAGRQSLQGRW